MPSLAVTTTFGNTAFAQGEPVEVRVALKNVGTQNVAVVKPLITPNLVFFRVRAVDGHELLFLGPWTRLAPFGREMFTKLAVGEFTEQPFDLAQLYWFREGTSYRVTAIYQNHDDGSRFGLSALTTDGLESNTVIISME